MALPFDWLAGELALWEGADRGRPRRVFRPCPDGLVEVEGRRLVNLASNDYLGLAADPRLTAAAREALVDCGTGSRASALVSGRTPWHERLEDRLARFEHAERAVLFPTGYAANAGTIAALVGPGDAVFCDRLNHASLIDGSRLSRAKFRVYPHLDLAALAREFIKASDCRRRLIVTDSVFSMDGDVAPLADLLALADRHEAMLLVDEAHATGVLGPGGRGLAEHDGIDASRLVRVGTLSKALGGMGGFVAGNRDLADWVWNTARPQMFSTSLPPSVAAAACAAIDIVESEPWRRLRLSDLSSRVRNFLRSAGFSVPVSRIDTPIIPVLLGEERRALQVARGLEEAGFLVAAIRPPAVPRGASRLRIALHALLDDETVTRLEAALSNALRS